MKQTTKKTTNLSVNIPFPLWEKLEKVSKFEERSKSYYARKFLEKYLDEKLEHIGSHIDAQKTAKE